MRENFTAIYPFRGSVTICDTLPMLGVDPDDKAGIMAPVERRIRRCIDRLK